MFKKGLKIIFENLKNCLKLIFEKKIPFFFSQISFCCVKKEICLIIRKTQNIFILTTKKHGILKKYILTIFTYFFMVDLKNNSINIKNDGK